MLALLGLAAEAELAVDDGGAQRGSAWLLVGSTSVCEANVHSAGQALRRLLAMPRQRLLRARLAAKERMIGL